MARLVLLTGGNMDEVAANMERAEAAIEERIGRISERSSVMESEAWGFESENGFLNRVLVVDTRLGPDEVLDEAQGIEKELGRVRVNGASGYASRTMDIDILYYDDIVMDTERLKIPHPLIGMREFVLRPLCEIMPEHFDPRRKKTVAGMLASITEG